MFKYRGVNFIKTVYRPYPPLITSLFCSGFGKKYWHDYFNFNYELKDMIEIEGVFYYSEYHYIDFAKKATRYLLKDEKNFLKLKKATLTKEKNILCSIVSGKGNNFKELFKDYLPYQATMGFYLICDDFIDEYLRKELNKKISPQETDKIMSHLNLPLELNLDQKMKLWFLKTEDVDNFIRKNSWNFSRYGQHKILSRKEAVSILRDLKKDRSFGDGKNRIETRLAIKKVKTILGKKSFYVDVMQFFVYYRTHRSDIINKVFYSYYERLANLAAKIDLSYDDLIYCSYDELVANNIPSQEVLSERKKDFVACFSLGDIKIFSGKETSIFKKLIEEKKVDDIIIGRPAYSGLITGPVKIINSLKDMESFKLGNILVASMTTPGMLMVMKKADAFITDEGGITCHAAILAREMKKPCIIGTKVATKVLCDGDLVEVDANKGVVKIIKRK